jgi:hypothetical protein
LPRALRFGDGRVLAVKVDWLGSRGNDILAGSFLNISKVSNMDINIKRISPRVVCDSLAFRSCGDRFRI